MSRKKDEWREHEAEIQPIVDRDLGLVEEVMRGVLPFTKPVFLREGLNRAPVQIGSGIVAKLADEVFLLTAAHAMENFRGQRIFIPLDGQYVQLEGSVFHNYPGPNGFHTDKDEVDTAVLHIEGEHKERLLDVAYPLEEAFFLRTIPPTSCVAVGYPLRLSQKVGRQIFSYPMGWLLQSKDVEFYKKLKLNAAQNMAFGMSKRVATEHGFAPRPALRGMSGCGVWLTPRIDGIAQPHRLIGIFTGINRLHALALSTSLVRHLQCISHCLPGLASLEKTNENDRVSKLLVKRL
jgi:hypothetical protein